MGCSTEGWAALGCAAIALLLAGCFKVNMDLEVAADNTVSGTAIIAVDESLLELTGQNVGSALRGHGPVGPAPGSTVEAYEEDGFVGQEITFADMPLESSRGTTRCPARAPGRS